MLQPPKTSDRERIHRVAVFAIGITADVLLVAQDERCASGSVFETLASLMSGTVASPRGAGRQSIACSPPPHLSRCGPDNAYDSNR